MTVGTLMDGYLASVAREQRLEGEWSYKTSMPLRDLHPSINFHFLKVLQSAMIDPLIWGEQTYKLMS